MKTQNTDTRYDVLAFDFDNTLFDYELTENQALKIVFKEMGYNYKPEFQHVFKTINRKLWDISEKDSGLDKHKLRTQRFFDFFSELGYVVDDSAVKYASEIFVAHSRVGYLIDGVLDTIRTLKKSGVKIVVASAGLSDPRIYKLEKSPINQFVDYSLFRENFSDGKIKPHIDFFMEIANRHPNVPLEKILYVGDTFDSDIKPSKLAGLSNVWFNYFNVDESLVEMQYCDLLIYKFKDLLKIL